MAKNKNTTTKSLIDSIKEQFDFASQYWKKQYQLSERDIKFCSSEHQWPESVKQARVGRPTYASDRINAQV
jgi:hypothetical protein